MRVRVPLWERSLFSCSFGYPRGFYRGGFLWKNVLVIRKMLVRLWEQKPNAMEKAIYKYPLIVADTQTVTLPQGAEILSVQVQNSNPMLWALVNTDPFVKTENRVIKTYGTGEPIYESDTYLKYISTYQLSNGSLVFHVFEYTY